MKNLTAVFLLFALSSTLCISNIEGKNVPDDDERVESMVEILPQTGDSPRNHKRDIQKSYFLPGTPGLVPCYNGTEATETLSKSHETWAIVRCKACMKEVHYAARRTVIFRGCAVGSEYNECPAPEIVGETKQSCHICSGDLCNSASGVIAATSMLALSLIAKAIH